MCELKSSYPTEHNTLAKRSHHKFFTNDIPLSGKDLRAAIESMLAGEEMPSPQYPSGGCNIKWK